MDAILQQIADYKKEIDAFAVSSPQLLEEYRIKFLGTKGIVKGLFGEMKNVPAESRKEFGLVLNEFKQFAEAKYETSKDATLSSAPTTAEKIDLSLPGDPIPAGSRHPINIVRQRIINIFQRLG